MNFIKKLQNKPRLIRIQILWISVVLTMLIIISWWLMHLKSSLGTNQEIQEKEFVPSLFGTIKEDFSFLKGSLEAEVKKVLESGKEKPKFEVEIIR